ncbi:hypothetical protein [Pandoraea communis]|uniref:hypothetical protein n=1 Tax=Pandoraea communis TaxID=2508297 RepID=UPI0025A5EB6A|nr:hypothetical protein [Pandoraea communis]MDM8359055.1 hypothetical protein [Pandoraea communis]
MKTSTVPIVALLLLGGCDGKPDKIKGCVLGEETPVPLQKAIEVVKAAGMEVKESTPPSPEGTAQLPIRRFSLLCEAAVSGQRLTKVLDVDLDAGTVNATSARVSATEISWKTPRRDRYTGRNMSEMHELNRLNGDYRSYVEGLMYSGPPPTYTCAPAPKPAF